MVKLRRDCRGQRAWHVVREASGTWETLMPPQRGKAYQPQEERLMGLSESDHPIVL